MTAPPLPPRAPVPNTEQGLYRKYDVRRTDFTDAPGQKHYGCEHFVLDVTHDPAAKAALAAYADAIEATHPQLARDMRERYGLAAVRGGEAVAEVYHLPSGDARIDFTRDVYRNLAVGTKLYDTPQPAGPKHGDDAGDGMRYVLCKVGFGDHYRNWLLIPHADGQYVTAAQLQPFSMSILQHALAAVAPQESR